MNLALALVGALLLRQLLPLHFSQSHGLLVRILATFTFSNLMLMVFNLVPIPPLDGSRVVTALLPPRLAWEYLRLERYGFLIVLALLNFVPPFGNALDSMVMGIFNFLLS